jgi:GTP-binding protein EngB required for normal cell division
MRRSGTQVKVMSQPNPGLESGPRRQASSHGPEADALLDEVRQATATLAKLLSHEGELGVPVTLAIRTALAEVSGKLDRRDLRVAVVGEERSGKSTFIDALLGERLLGLARTPPNSVITIRCTPDIGYRARLTDGFTDDFAVRMPDPTAKWMAEVESAEARLAEAKRRNVAATIEVAAAADALERLQHAMTDAFRGFEAARTGAEHCGAKLETTQKTWGQLCRDVTERADALPARVRRPPPPKWAVWSWVILIVALLLNWRRWRRHRALLTACGKAETEVDRLRAESSRAAEKCTLAEAKLAEANLPVESARRGLETCRGVARDAEAACSALQHELGERRDAIGHRQIERKRRFVADVLALSNIDDRGRDVVDLEIDHPARLLPEDIVLIEAPGVTSENVSSSVRAWQTIRERADACILVSELGRAVSGTTQRFLQLLCESVPHAILVLTKMDEVHADAVRKGDGNPAEQVERARRIGIRRFARETGRDPSAVLSVTVAAEEALRDAPSSAPDRERFHAEVATLFTLLRYERALILGASAAGIVRRCIGDLTAAERRAALAHQERIATLEAKRIPSPDQFYAEQVASVLPAIAEKAKSIVSSCAASALKANTDLARVACKTKIAACTTRSELRGLAPELDAVIVTALTLALDEVRSELATRGDRAVQELEKSVLQALRERYYILHEVTRSIDVGVVDAPLGRAAPPAELAAKLDHAVASFDRVRLGFGAGGAALGAGLGTLVMPGIGSLAGALMGGLATFAKRLDALKREFGAVTDEVIAGCERRLGEQIQTAERPVANALGAALGKSLEHALARFARFIDEPIEEERAAIESERRKLAELESLHEQLQAHDARLDSLIKAATAASVGLSFTRAPDRSSS